MASNHSDIEIVMVKDNDDGSFADFPIAKYPDIKLFSVERSHFFQRDYNNFAAAQTTGRVIWGLNDDCEMGTKNWDQILSDKVQQIESLQQDDIFYIGMNDGTHGPGTIHTHQPSCCFPIVSKAACDAMEAFMPGEINMWGADIALYNIFKQLKANRIYSCPELSVIHKSAHSSVTTRDRDDGYWHVANISRCTSLTSQQHMSYVHKLERVMK